VVAGVSNQRPAGPVRFAEKVREDCRTRETLLALASAHEFSQFRHKLDRFQVIAFDIGAKRAEFLLWPCHVDAGEIFVGGESDRHPALSRADM